MRDLQDFQIILEESAFDDKKVSVKTKGRGVITGMFTGVDEYDTDPERFGFWIRTKAHEIDTVFLDEIVSVETLKEGDRIMSFVDILDDAMYRETELLITTKERGQIIGVPSSVDYYDTDDERFGYFIRIGEHLLDNVFIDEITEIITADTLHDLKLASGK